MKLNSKIVHTSEYIDYFYTDIRHILGQSNGQKLVT